MHEPLLYWCRHLYPHRPSSLMLPFVCLALCLHALGLPPRRKCTGKGLAASPGTTESPMSPSSNDSFLFSIDLRGAQWRGSVLETGTKWLLCCVRSKITTPPLKWFRSKVARRQALQWKKYYKLSSVGVCFWSKKISHKRIGFGHTNWAFGLKRCEYRTGNDFVWGHGTGQSVYDNNERTAPRF